MENHRINPNYCDTVTIYNRVASADNDGKEGWASTQLENCFFNVRTTVSASEGMFNAEGTYILRIPASTSYKPYQEWKDLKDKAGTFTASKGDLVVLGAVDDTIDGTKGHRASDVLLKYQPDAFKVMSISDNSRYPFGGHYKLGG